MKTTSFFFAALASIALAATAGAAGKVTLEPSGQTIGGPADATVAAGTTAAVVSQIPSVDACVTLVNTGRATVELELVGSGTGAIQVPTRETGIFCRGGLQTVNVTCLATGSGTCSVTFRVDRAK